MSETHTPGKWTVKQQVNGLWEVCGHAPNAAQTPLIVAYDLSEANARLIAAAPDLLVASRMMRNTSTGGRIPWVHNAAHTLNTDALRAICLAFSDVWNNHMMPAIRKAGVNI